jgi:hypothetical protein
LLFDGFVLSLVVIFLFDEFGNILVDVSLPDLILEAIEFFLDGGLTQILILLEAHDDRCKGLLLVVQVLPEVYHLIFELYHSLLIELLIRKSHLLLHQQRCVDVLVLVVVLFQSAHKEGGLIAERGNRPLVAPQLVVLTQHQLVYGQILLQV